MKIKSLIKHNLMRAAMMLALIMTCATAWAQTTQSVTYIDENGQTQTVNAKQITSDNFRMYPDTWYYVSGTVGCPDDNLYLMQQNGTHNLILCDGATLTVQQVEQLNYHFAKLRIFGQSGGTGKLNVGTGNVVNAIHNCDFALYGGEVTLTYLSTWGYGTDKNVDFNGGKLTATSGANGIGGNTTINATSGWIKASKYGGSVTIAEGKYMKDETGRCYKGTLTDAEKAAVAGKTLQPATQTEYISYIFGGGNGSQNSPYLIGSTESWNYFCDALLDNNTWNHFSGKYVKLGANISVSRMAGNNDHPFSGTFDGDGKTLTFNYGSEGTPSNEDYIAPFRYTDGATISGLHVSGNIYTQHTHSAGIIGLASGTTTVSNCRSSINIISSINGDGTHGGLIACTWTGSTTNITGCLFDGSIQSASGYATDQCGGFVGWRNNTINVTNSLLIADLSTIGDVTGNYPSCTFVRSGVSSITNSYYTAALGTVQGKLRHSITAGANTTVANAGTATTYDVSGITSYGTGILYDGVLYAGNGDAVSLTLTHQDPPEGYTFNGYIPSAGTLNGTTLTMPDEDVIISAPWAPISYAITYNLEGGNLPTGQSNPESYTIESNDIELVNPIKSGYNFVGWTGTGLNGPTQTVIIAHGSMGIREYTAIWSVSVNYINENGVEQTVTALPLTGSETTLAPGWYVVENTNPNGVDLAYTEGLSCSGGDLNLILCDGAEMTVTGAYTYDAITLDTLDGAYTLTIYGQSQQSGKLTLTGSEYGKCIHSNSGSIVMNGGIVNATADTDGAIECYSFTMNGGSFSANSNSSYDYDHAIQIGDSFTFNGGNFSAISANASGIEGAWSSVNLSWTNTSDSFYVSSLGQVSINIAEGKDFVDEDNTLHTHDEPGDIAGKTLRPFNGCYPPMHLTANAITTSTATLTWEAGNIETQWQVSWSTDGGSNWSTPVTVNNVPQYEITSLSPETTVQAQVKSVCDESVYSAPISITFTTRSLCDSPESLTCNSYSTSAVLGWTGYQDSYNVRYSEFTLGDAVTATEGFEHDGEMPEGWTMLDLGDGNNTSELGISTDAAQDGGSYGFRFSSYSGNSEGSFDQYLISPELNNLTALSFAFKSSQGTNDVFRVGYSTTTNDVSAFTWGDETASANSWATYTENPGNIPANAKYFAINYTAVYQYRLYIDNITYTYTPLIVGTWNETNTSVTSPLTISGLTPETQYAWQVQGSNCDGEGSTTEWSEEGTFTTLAGIDLTVAGYEEGNGGWVFIASPLAGSIAPTEVHNLFPSAGETSNDYDLYRFNQAAELEWENWKAEGTDNYHFNLEPGKGYLYATKETRTLVFAGEYTAATGSVEVPLTYDENAKFAGWNLVGNPFATQATMTDLDDNPVSFYVINGQNVVPYDGNATTIEPCTGVMVKAEGTGESVFFTSVSPDQAPQPNNGSLQIALSQVTSSLRGTKQSSALDNAIISFNEGSKLSKFYFGTQNANVYIPQDNEEYAIVSVGRDAARHVSTMPINFQTKENGTYTIAVNIDNVEMSYLHLIDNMTGADIDLLSTQNVIAGEDPQSPALSYTFTAKTTDYESRFKLVFSTNDEDGPSTGSGTFAFIDASGNIIITGVETCHGASLQMVDMMGRVLVCRDALNASLSLSTAGMTLGVYVLRLIDGDTIRTQKIVIE